MMDNYINTYEGDDYKAVVYKPNKNYEVILYDLHISTTEPNERITCRSLKQLKRIIKIYTDNEI